MRSLFLGTYEIRIDAKGRVLVPVAFRQSLSEDGEPALVCHRGINCNALEGVSTKTLHDSFNALRNQYEMYSEEYEAAISILSDATSLSWDTGGRVQLPERLLKKADIQNEITFVGLGDRFRMWNPNIYQKHLTTIAQTTKDKKITLSIPPRAK
ncbi:MAG: hypothetical protein OD811_04815 [Alphaproteobacteria bacterium]